MEVNKEIRNAGNHENAPLSKLVGESDRGIELCFYVTKILQDDLIDFSSILEMNHQAPALLAFAKKEKKDNNDSIYKYLADAGFERDEVDNWGKIGSLEEALRDDDGQPCSKCILDNSFIEFIQQLPAGNTPRPTIRHQMQRPTVV